MNIKIILASTRQGRFGDKPAQWILDLVKKSEGVNVELLDLKEWELPPFTEPVPPSMMTGEYRTPEINRWAEKIKEADGFIMVTPEYNHGYPSSLKNNIDYLAREWYKKPVAFVSYGAAGGVRAVEQLRQVIVQLQMAPVSGAVHIMSPWLLTNEDGSLKAGVLDSYVAPAQEMIKQLLWWTEALKNAREKK